MSNQCNQCGSYAINHRHHGRDGSDPDLCDVCYWHTRHDQLQAELAEVKAELALALKVPSIAAMHTWLDSDCAKQNKQLGDELAALKAKAAGHLVTDGGRNQRYIGFFEGETPEQREERLADTPAQPQSDMFWAEKLAIKFCAQRGIADSSPNRAIVVDAFTSGLRFSNNQKQSDEVARLNSAAPSKPQSRSDALEAIDFIDDFIARCNGDDRGSCESVNIIRRALLGGDHDPAL